MKFSDVVRLLEENGYTANYRLIERVGGACAPAHSKPNRRYSKRETLSRHSSVGPLDIPPSLCHNPTVTVRIVLAQKLLLLRA